MLGHWVIIEVPPACVIMIIISRCCFLRTFSAGHGCTPARNNVFLVECHRVTVYSPACLGGRQVWCTRPASRSLMAAWRSPDVGWSVIVGHTGWGQVPGGSADVYHWVHWLPRLHPGVHECMWSRDVYRMRSGQWLSGRRYSQLSTVHTPLVPVMGPTFYLPTPYPISSFQGQKKATKSENFIAFDISFIWTLRTTHLSLVNMRLYLCLCLYNLISLYGLHKYLYLCYIYISLYGLHKYLYLCYIDISIWAT